MHAPIHEWLPARSDPPTAIFLHHPEKQLFGSCFYLDLNFFLFFSRSCGVGLFFGLGGFLIRFPLVERLLSEVLPSRMPVTSSISAVASRRRRSRRERPARGHLCRSGLFAGSRPPVMEVADLAFASRSTGTSSFCFLEKRLHVFRRFAEVHCVEDGRPCPGFSGSGGDCGRAATQGPHHVAQKSSMTTFLPMTSCSLNASPSSTSTSNSGAALPTSARGGCGPAPGMASASDFSLLGASGA